MRRFLQVLLTLEVAGVSLMFGYLIGMMIK